ncbi:hypothetical protein ACERK3_19085 [Phycisphaerales bacterium AB-hyl4]|uniref:Uncharacterized protein n=1 Tax=Natronomicrosphaera hydrolytica TaxID=3242702 RepID=A0ABV4UA02_9BACT
MTLIGTLAVMTLLGAFMVLAGHLFSQAMTITRDGSRTEQDVMQIDAFVRHLRQDVWEAGRFEVSSPNHLMIERDRQPYITWRITRHEDDNGQAATQITRQTNDNPDSRTAMRFAFRPTVRIEGQGASVQLHIGEQSATLVSQRRLLEVQP